MNTKEQLQDKMIRIFGFEARETIMFFNLCENPNWSIKQLEEMMNFFLNSLEEELQEDL